MPNIEKGFLYPGRIEVMDKEIDKKVVRRAFAGINIAHAWNIGDLTKGKAELLLSIEGIHPSALEYWAIIAARIYAEKQEQS